MILRKKRRCDIKVLAGATSDDFLPGDLVVFRKGISLIPVNIQPRRIGNGQIVTDYHNWSTTMDRDDTLVLHSKEVALCVDRFNKAITLTHIVVLYQESYWAVSVSDLTRKIAYEEV